MKIATSHPVSGPRYGNLIHELENVWRSLLPSEAFVAWVFEETTGEGAPRILGAGVVAFVSDAFMAELKKPPHFWFSREIARRVTLGASPLLSNKELRTANAVGGLNLVLCHALVRAEDSGRLDLQHIVSNAFYANHAGYLLKEMVMQFEWASMDQWTSMRRGGLLYLNPKDGRYGNFPDDENADRIVASPHVCGLMRTDAIQLVTLGIGSLFMRRDPMLGLSRGEQRILLSALDGTTAEEIAEDLGISLSAVKKTWSSAYARAERILPELGNGFSPREFSNRSRGKDKKPRLLAYVREHPEELRPINWKHLAKSSLSAQPAHDTGAADLTTS